MPSAAEPRPTAKMRKWKIRGLLWASELFILLWNNYNDIKPKRSSLLAFNRVYRLEIQSIMLVFSTPLVNHCPSNLLTGSAPPPLLIRKGLCIYTVCNGGGEGSGCVESIYKSYTLCIWSDSEQFLYHPKQKPRRGGGLRQINTLLRSPFTGKFSRKADI